MERSVTELPEQPLAVPSFGFEAEPRAGLRHWLRVGIASLVVNVLILVTGVSVARLPSPAPVQLPTIELDARPRNVTKLVAPRPDRADTLTQKAPNRDKLTQEFNLSSLPPRPAQRNVPSSPGAAAVPRQRFQLPDRTSPAPPKPAVPDTAAPPPVDTAQLRTNAPPPAIGSPLAVPPPRIEPQEKPKLTFETPGAATGGSPTGVGRTPVTRPGTTIEETAREVARGAGRGLIVGDEEATPGSVPTSPSVPIPGKLGSAVELLSDPQGVDFWPYLVKVLTTVRRNWFSVIPESARFGRQGRTVIQFAINRDGSVPKLVIATPSGAESLDRAAVASISASNPFLPLPPEFKGGQVRLQFVFKYNVK